MALPTSLLDRPNHVDTAETDAAIPGGIGDALLPLALGAPLDSLIVSDLHLGLRGSRSAELLKLLQMLRFDRLVLLGDILHDATLRRLSRDDWALIAFSASAVAAVRGSFSASAKTTVSPRLRSSI